MPVVVNMWVVEQQVAEGVLRQCFHTCVYVRIVSWANSRQRFQEFVGDRRAL